MKKLTMQEIENEMSDNQCDTYIDYVLMDMGVYYECKVRDLLYNSDFYVIYERFRNRRFDRFGSIWGYNRVYNCNKFIDYFYFDNLDELINFEKENSFEKSNLHYWVELFYNFDIGDKFLIFTDVDKKRKLKEVLKDIYLKFTGFKFCKDVANLDYEIRDFYHCFYKN